MTNSCFPAIKALDGRIVNYFKDASYYLNEHQTAILRGLYYDRYKVNVEDKYLTDGKTLRDLTDEDIANIAETLNALHETLTKEDRVRINDSMFNPSASYSQLKDAYSPQQRNDRVEFIATLFSDVVDNVIQEAAEDGIDVTRDQVIQGCMKNGVMMYGPQYIFQKIIDTISEAQLDAIRNAEEPSVGGVSSNVWTYRAQEWTKMLHNLGALMVMANKRIREVEGYNIAKGLQFAFPSEHTEHDANDTSFSFNPEEQVKDRWQEAIDGINPFTSLSKPIKRLLGNIREFTSTEDKYLDDLGIPRKQSAAALHMQLMVLLRGVENEQDLISKLVNANKEFYPYVDAILEAFMDNPTLRTQFFVDFSKIDQQYSIISTKGGDHLAIINKANKQRAFGKYLANLKVQRILESASSIFKYDEENKKTLVNKDNVNALRASLANKVKTLYYDYDGTQLNSEEEFTQAQQKYEKKISNGELGIMTNPPRSESNLNALIEEINRKPQGQRNYQPIMDVYNEVFSALGIGVDPITYQTILNNRNLYRELNNAIEDIQYGLKDIGANTDFIEAITENNGDERGNAQKLIENLFTIVDSLQNTALLTKGKFQGNDFYTDVQSSYLGRLKNKIKNLANIKGLNRQQHLNVINNWLKEEFGSNSFFFKDGKWRVKWLQDFAAENPALGKSLINQWDYSRLLGETDRKFEDFGFRTQSLANLTCFFSERDTDYGNFPVFILGDSGTQKTIKARVYNEETIMQSFIEAAKQDIDLYKQMIAQKQALEKAFEEQFEDINIPDGVDVAAYKEKCKKDFLGSFYYTKENTTHVYALMPFLNNYTDRIDVNQLDDSLRGCIEEHLLEEFKEYKDNLIADGVLVQTERGLEFAKNHKSYLKKGIPSNGRNTSIMKSDSKLDKSLWNYFINHKMAMLNQIQLLTVSTAFYAGGTEGMSLDFQKRFKEVHATGNRLSIDAQLPDGSLASPTGSQKVVYFSDPNTDVKDTDSDFYECLQKCAPDLAEMYRSSKSTDGQSYRTLDSYMRVLTMAGKMTDELYNVWQNIENIRADIRENPEMTDSDKEEYKELMDKFSKKPLTEEESERLARLKELKSGITREQRVMLEDCMVALQPIKSFIYTWERIPNKEGGVTMIPVQIKHSECVVIPELLPKGSKLRNMMEWAESEGHDGRPNADMISSDTTCKVGLYGAVDIHSLSSDGIVSALTMAKVHELSYEDYVIQQNVPEHIRESRLIGTQGRKVVFSDLRHTTDDGNVINYSSYLENDAEGMTINDEFISNSDIDSNKINQMYVAINAANILEDLDKFVYQLGNPDKVRNLLVQMTMNADRTSYENLLGLDKKLGPDGELIRDFIVPLFEGGVEYDNIALLMSMFRNQVNKQKMLGGSAVQATAYGLTELGESDNLHFITDDDKTNILYGECETPFDFAYTPAGSNTPVALEWDDWVEPDGRPKLSNITLMPGDKRYNDYKSFKDDNGVVHIPLMEVKFPGILDLIATRIPTEAKYSTMPLKIVRFTHKVAGGGVLKLPLQGVTIAGFDYDIDKLYLQRREYKQIPLSAHDISKVWENIYLVNPSIKERLKAAKAKFAADWEEFLSDRGLEEVDKVANGIWDEVHKRLGDKTIGHDTMYNRLESYFYGTPTDITGVHIDYDDLTLEEQEIYNTIITPNIKTVWEGIENLSEEDKDYFKKGLKLLNKEEENGSRLYYYWEEAGFKGTAKEHFQTFLKNHVKDDNMPLVSESYDYSKNPQDKTQSRIGRNNLLFNLMYRRLQDPNTLRERFTPGGFEHIKEAASFMDDLMGVADKAYDYSDPYTMIIYNQQNQVAGKLIGIFANQNSNTAISTLLDTLEIVSPIAFGKHVGLGKSDLKIKDPLVKELLAAAVDAVKDPRMASLGLNTITATSAALLARLGYDFEDIGLLLQQPALRDVVREALNAGYSDISSLIENKIKELKKIAKIDLSDSNITAGLDFETLKSSIIKNRNGSPVSIGDAITQIKVLKLFKEIKGSADELANFVGATKNTASNSVKATLGEMYAQRIKIKKFINSLNKGGSELRIKLTATSNYGPIRTDLSLDDRDAYFEDLLENPFGYEQAMYDSFNKLLEVIGEYTPYEKFEELREKLSDSCMGNINGDTINSFHKFFTKHLLSLGNSPFNPEMHIGEGGMTAGQYYTEMVPYRIAITLKNHPELKELAIFKYGEINEDKEGRPVFRLSLNDDIGIAERESITASWEELLSLGENYARMAKDIYIQNVYQSGFGYGVIGFNHLAPVAVKESISESYTTDFGEDHYYATYNYLDELQKIQDEDMSSINGRFSFREMMRDFIIANADNYQLVYSVPKYLESTLQDSEVLTVPFTADSGIIPTFDVYPNVYSRKSSMFQLEITGSEIKWKPAIKIKSGNKELLYIARPRTEDSITSNGDLGKMTYELAVDSNYEPINPALADSYNELDTRQAEPESTDIVDFGYFRGGDYQSFRASMMNISGRISEVFPAIGNQMEIYTELMGEIGEGVRNSFMLGEPNPTQSAFEWVKQVIKTKCDKEGYRGKINNELIC